MFAREALFIKEYIKIKYDEIYREAVNMYNTINRDNSTKPDLRKTMEFRCWKNTIAAANNRPLTPVLRQKQRSYERTTYRDIPVDTITTSPQGIADSPHHFRPVSPAKSPSDPRLIGRTMRLEIPLIQTQALPKPVQPLNTILSETTQEVTQEVMEEGDQLKDLNPSIIDELSPEIVENIINQLRADPGLKTMMDTIETATEKEQEEIDEEIIGLTIDLPELYDPLEEEMMCW